MPRLPSVQLPALFYWRIQRMLCQYELAHLAGVCGATIGHLEQGSRAELRTVRRLADALGVEPHALMWRPPEFNDLIITPPDLHDRIITPPALE